MSRKESFATKMGKVSKTNHENDEEENISTDDANSSPTTPPTTPTSTSTKRMNTRERMKKKISLKQAEKSNPSTKKTKTIVKKKKRIDPSSARMKKLFENEGYTRVSGGAREFFRNALIDALMNKIDADIEETSRLSSKTLKYVVHEEPKTYVSFCVPK